MNIIQKREWITRLWFLLLMGLLGGFVLTVQAANPEPAGWYAGDMHVHRSCGDSPEAISNLYSKMTTNNLATISLLADMGNGEVQNPVTDLPLVTGKDASDSTPGRIVHWDAEWHWDATYVQYPHQALGGHLVALGLGEAHQLWEEYTYPILKWADQQNGIAGFVHMQYLDNGIPQSLNCCIPIEYPVEVALGTADFIAEDVKGGDSAIQAYYRLLNNGFRPGFAAGTDYPCGVSQLGSLLTYVQVAGGQMTYRNWIEGIKAGRTVVSRNGHNEFLNLTVNNTATPGDQIPLTVSGSVPVTITWTANQNLTGTIELVKNGVVVASKQASVTSSTSANLSTTVDFTKSGWLAARRVGSNGHQSHTGAVFVTVNNQPVRVSVADAQFYVQWIDNLLTKTSPGGVWNSYFVSSLSAAHARYNAAKGIYQQIALEAGATPQPLAITTTSLPDGVAGLAYSAKLTASGGITPYSWSISSGLPAGLTHNSGDITGTPTTLGSYSFTVNVSDAANPRQTATKLLGIAIAATPPASTTIWPVATTPIVTADPDTSTVELGVKFRSSVSGFISGIRFYKGATNTGTHIGSLWDINGNLKAQATFTTETASGWQQVNFTTPMAIMANTTYVASYHAPNGRYSVNERYFASTGVTNGTLYAFRDGESGGNGVYRYGSVGFPSNTYLASNYWVDVVFSGTGSDNMPPTVTMTAPANGATLSGSAVKVSANASYNVGVAKVEFYLNTTILLATVTSSSYSFNWNTATVANGTYTLTARAYDNAGNSGTSNSVIVTVTNSVASIALAQKASNSTSNAQNLATTLPLPVTAGNLIVVSVSGWPNLPASTAVTDSLGNTYSIAGTALLSQGAYSAIYYAKNVKAGSNSVTFRTLKSGGQISMVVSEFSGVNTTSPLDKTAGAVGSGNTPASGTMIPSLTNELVIGSGTHNGNTTTSAGAGFTMIAVPTEDSNTHQPLAMEYRVLSGTQQTNATFSLSTGYTWTQNGALFKSK
ncbi:MAG: DUF4082 domain-containing protein [Methylococcaceae bacterium]